FNSVAQIDMHPEDFFRLDSVHAELNFNPNEKKVRGTADYYFYAHQALDSFYLNVPQSMQVKLNDLPHQKTGQQLWVFQKIPLGKRFKLSLSYENQPKQALYFIGWDDSEIPNQIWTQGQGKDTSHWLPCIDNQNIKSSYDLQVTFDKNYHVLSNGILTKKTEKNDEIVWQYRTEKPMSSYLLALAIGKYERLDLSAKSGIPIELYYYPNDKKRADRSYQHTQKIFDFLEQATGYDYPWGVFRQAPVKDFLYSGMENTTLTLFNDHFLTDSIAYQDYNYTNVNAHELAHHWFGNLVTAKNATHHWLHEGFATYFALLAEKELYGSDYFYWKLYESAEALTAQNQQGSNSKLLDPKANSLTFYQHGAWALFALHETLGDDAFFEIIKKYLHRRAFKNVTTPDFLDLVTEGSELNTKQYEQLWLQSETFPQKNALALLQQKPFMQAFFELAALRPQPLSSKVNALKEQLNFPVNPYLATEVVYQASMENSPEAIALLQLALASGNVEVRQSVSIYSEQLLLEFTEDFISLLEDDSYLTKENALYNLWAFLPNRRIEFLEKTNAIVGLNAASFRSLWLALAINTRNYKPEKRSEFIAELQNFAHPKFSPEIRTNAFQLLTQIQLFNTASLLQLAESCVHHSWRFAQSSRSHLEKVLENEDYRQEIILRRTQLSNTAAAYLQRLGVFD
ncbi:MAG: M1 family metallopeptidase, partial [Flavobacteriaceae bacterium]|nr:M1 family metallopeptidase [Flavobacteriaceae bacterium]